MWYEQYVEYVFAKDARIINLINIVLIVGWDDKQTISEMGKLVKTQHRRAVLVEV